MPTLQEVDAIQGPELLVPRIAKQNNFSEEKAAALFKEAKRMLYLHTLTKKPVSPSLDVDEAWHEMLMFTKFYKSFCDTIGVFVHHDPSPGPPDGGRTYASTKSAYEEQFGQKPDPAYWP